MAKGIVAICCLALSLVAILLLAQATGPDRRAPDPSPEQVDATRNRATQPTFTVASDWTILRNEPVGLAIGNARRGWGIDGPTEERFGYVTGFVGGSFRGCAWTARRNLVRAGGAPSTSCAGKVIEPASFIFRINCVRCRAGTAVRLVEPAIEYANHSRERGAFDPLRTVPAGRCVEWRWIPKGGGVAMVKDRTHPNNEGSWVFVPRSSLPRTLPSGYASRCGDQVRNRRP